MVGVFYAAPSPGEAPFVKVGQTVSAGETLGIIEAMKIMNPIEATQSGVIEEILVKNGEVIHPVNLIPLSRVIPRGHLCCKSFNCKPW